MTEKITPIGPNRATVGMDQLEQFDANGVAGPGVTFEIALRKVKRLSCEGKRWKELCASMLIHVEPGAGRRRAENYEAEYNDLVSEEQERRDG